MSEPEMRHRMPGKASDQTGWTLRWYFIAFLASPATVIAPEEEKEWREALFPTVFVVLSGLVTTKSMAVGRPGSSPGAVSEKKTNTSAGRYCVPKRRPSSSPQAYSPWKARPAKNASYFRKMVVR